MKLCMAFVLGVVLAVPVTLLVVRDHPSPLRDKMKRISIPEIDCRQAHILDMVQHLNQISGERAEDKKPVNIVVLSKNPDIVGRQPQLKCTLSATDMSLYDALNYFATQIGLEVRIDDTAVALVDPEK